MNGGTTIDNMIIWLKKSLGMTFRVLKESRKDVYDMIRKRTDNRKR